MRPSPILCKRLKTRVPFTTKEVGKGFYRGTGTGSTGSHTATGGYLIDYRKVRHFVLPDLKNCKLTPFVSAEMYKGYRKHEDRNGDPYKLPYDGLQYLLWCKNLNEAAYSFELDQAARAANPTAQTSSSREQPLWTDEEDKSIPTNSDSANSPSSQR